MLSLLALPAKILPGEGGVEDAVAEQQAEVAVDSMGVGAKSVKGSVNARRAESVKGKVKARRLGGVKMKARARRVWGVMTKTKTGGWGAKERNAEARRGWRAKSKGAGVVEMVDGAPVPAQSTASSRFRAPRRRFTKQLS